MQKHNQYNINFDDYRFYPNVLLISSAVAGPVFYEEKLGYMFREINICSACKTNTKHIGKPIQHEFTESGTVHRKWRYLSNDTIDARTLAHELQARSVRPDFQKYRMLNRDELKTDGRTNPDERSGIGRRLTLRHTFSSELCGGQPGHTANQNLMDYGFGTGLNRFQWEAIHNPAIIGKMFQSDEDGASIDLAKAEFIEAPITSGLFLTPSCYPIWLENLSQIAILKESGSGINADEVLTEAIYGFEIDGIKYLAEIVNNTFKGYYMEGTTDAVIVYYDSYKDGTYTETAKSAYNINLWDFDKSFTQTGITNDEWFIKPANNADYNIWDVKISNIDKEYAFKPCGYLWREVKNNPLAQGHAFTNPSNYFYSIVKNNPCVLSGMRPIGEGLGYETEFMKGMNSFVAVGLAAAFAVPVVEILLAPVVDGVVQYVGEEVMRDFITGAVIEAAMYYGVSYYTNQPINYDDFALDIVIAGARNIDLMPVETQPLVACIQGIDMGEVRKVLSKQKQADEVFFFQRIAECVIPYLIESAIPQNSAMSRQFYQEISNASTTKLVRLFRHLGFSSEIQLRLIIYQKNLSELLESKLDDWVLKFKELLPTDGGAAALDMLIDASFDIARLSKGSLEKLSEICRVIAGNDAAIAKLTNLFKGTKDFQRMIQHLYRTASTPDQYIKCMDDIATKFDGTITVGSKKWNIPQFLDEFEYPGTMFEYYHTQTAGKHYLLKYESNTQQGFLLVIDDIGKTIVDADSRVLVNFTKSQVEEIFGTTEGEQ